jgi:hypothetical protein
LISAIEHAIDDKAGFGVVIYSDAEGGVTVLPVTGTTTPHVTGLIHHGLNIWLDTNDLR